MYKKFFMGIAAMAALTLVSCSSDDLNSLSDNSSKNEAISFDGYLGRSAVAVNGSRGSVLDLPALQGENGGFGVFGNYNSTGGQEFVANLFNNEKVTFSSSTEPAKWTYTNTKYWPAQGHIDFLAYAPYADKTTLNENTSCINFTVSSTITEQKDLLWANAKDQTKQTISSTDNKVKFKFAHALSKLGYSVKLKGALSGTTITLKKITLAGSADGTTKAFYTKGTIDLVTGKWSTLSNDTKQKFEWLSGDKTLSNNDDVIKNSDNEYLFVIPQNFSEAGTDNLYVIVEYTISSQATITNTVYKQLTKNFEQGKAYMINLTIGLTPIEFDAEVTPWGNDDSSDITWE